MANESSQALFHIHNVSKIYTMGDVQVNALRGVDFDLWAGFNAGQSRSGTVIRARPRS